VAGGGRVLRALTPPTARQALPAAPLDVLAAPLPVPIAARRRSQGPGPSKLAYRLSRIWKKLWLRRAVQLVAVLCLVLLAGRVAMSPAVPTWLGERRAAVVAALSSRPEFAVRDFRVTGASDALVQTIGRAVALVPGTSSLTLDVAAVQSRIAALGPVRSARVKLGPDGILRIAVEERIAEALWRDADGALWLADREGVTIGPAGPRAGHPALPVIIGEGAPAAMAEALALFRAVPELQPRLRAFIRVGQRRWDLALDRGLTIMLPEQGAEAALARIMALHYGEELLDRDLAVIDMRLGERPTLRMTPEAVETIHLRDAAGGDPGRRT
jgi:cell division protein FtsQ